MARKDSTAVESEVEDVVVDESAEVDTVAEDGDAEKAESKPKAPKRGDLAEGQVTPIGLAKALSEPKDGNAENDDPSNWYHTDRNGKHEVRPQMVYSYMKNSPKEDRLETVETTDSNGVARKVLELADGLAWWERKNARVGERKANAATKADKKAANAAKKAEAGEATSDETPTAEVVEAE